MDSEESSLAARLQSGEVEAFDEVVREYHGSLYRLARRLLQNDADAQEIVQESFLAAFEGRTRFAARSTVRTWLLSITYHKAMDRLKRTARDDWAIFGELEGSEIWEKSQKVKKITEWGENPEQNFEREALLACLQEALEKVPAESKAVYELQDIQGMNSREVAETLGITEGAARVRLHRVRQFLMAALVEFHNTQGS